MKNLRFVFTGVLFVALSFLVAGCNGKEEQSKNEISQKEQPIVCPKGLAYSVCNNSSALHGQIMVHNMTDKSYDVTVYHHGSDGIETKQILPGKGWTFTGVLQGQRMIVAKPTTGGDIEESYCMVVGAMQHIMNITHYGMTQVEKKSHM